jgi:hypothetical protein
MKVALTWRWGLLAAVGVALPASAHAATAQVIGARDTGADIAVDARGRAFLVSPSTERDREPLVPVRVRSAAPGALFGPSRTLMRSRRTERAVDAGVAADGSGVIVVQSLRAAYRRVRVVTFDARGRLGPPAALSSRHADADFAGSAVAPTGAAVVVWFRHRDDGRWRLEVAVREPGARAFGAPEPLSAFVRRACCTSVSVAIGGRGDAVATWTSTARPAVWAALRSHGQRFHRARRLARDAADAPRAVVGAGGAAAVLYSVQHVPARASDGLQLHRAPPAGELGAAEHVDPFGGVTIGEAAVTASGRVVVAWIDRAQAARGTTVHVAEAAPGEPLATTAQLGSRATADGLAIAADDDGRAVVAWSELVATHPAYRERAVAAARQSGEGPFAAPIALGRRSRATEPGLARLVPGGGALVVWKASRFAGRPARRVTLAVTRLP